MLAVAESCTGGMMSQVLTSVPGSSKWFERGLVTYSNASKRELLGVDTAAIGEFGAVSRQVVREMAAGVLLRSKAQLGVAISGVAGPEGGTPSKPVGSVWLAWDAIDYVPHQRLFNFSGGREEVRQQAVVAALEGIIEMLGEGPSPNGRH
ncbi:MAG: CinA family protein [Gammaproteobacteria bacterium]|nr:CinA family protein [Gammaproteobacteria bacterium]